ncbi:MAG: type II toxin-antitoxin system VapB family antitoxin [Nitrospirota bacterium]
MSTTLKVRKQFILDSSKIKAVRKITKAKTDTEAINKALDLMIANSKIKEMLASIEGKGNIKDVYGRVSC